MIYIYAIYYTILYSSTGASSAGASSAGASSAGASSAGASSAGASSAGASSAGASSAGVSVSVAGFASPVVVVPLQPRLQKSIEIANINAINFFHFYSLFINDCCLTEIVLFNTIHILNGDTLPFCKEGHY